MHDLGFCPKFHRAVELIGRRWTGVIVRSMMRGAVRFSDISAAVPGLSDRLLSERLKELESEGVVLRSVYPETPVRIEYRLTEKGAALSATVAAIASWAEIWGTGLASACPAGEAPACDEVTIPSSFDIDRDSRDNAELELAASQVRGMGEDAEN